MKNLKMKNFILIITLIILNLAFLLGTIYNQ